MKREEALVWCLASALSWRVKRDFFAHEKSAVAVSQLLICLLISSI